jgi:hypothetical protein
MKIERKQKSVGLEIKEKQGHKQSKQNKPTEERMATTYFGQLLSRSHFLWKNVKVLEKMPFPLGKNQNNV